jgi:predicted Rossmann-fold nucleotide-binding protein
MDELWEAVSWAQLGYHTKPVGLLNAFGFYDGLIGFLRHMVAVGFVRPAHAGIVIAENDLGALLQRMESYRPHRPIFRMKADEL